MTPLRSNPVVHLELHTGDLPQARDLYAELCGWRPEWIETRAGSYLSLELGDGLGGGIVECGIRHPLWLPYVEVAELGALRLAPGMDRDASRLLPLPGARRRARGRDRRVRYPAPALAALRRGRRDRRGHRPGPQARGVRPPGAERGPGGVAKRRRHPRRRRDRLLAAQGSAPVRAGDGVNERRLLEAARAGDEDAFARLVEPHRRALHAHCYRMFGSMTDAEDALQEALLSAWRGLPGFEERSSLRSWLYSIATNACLRTIERRPKRVFPSTTRPRRTPTTASASPWSNRSGWSPIRTTRSASRTGSPVRRPATSSAKASSS